MPIYEIEAPDGRILEIEGSQPPTEAELDKIFEKTKTKDPYNYDDIVNNTSLSKEQKLQAIKERGDKINRDINREKNIELAKQYGGAALQIGSAAIPVGAGARLGVSLIKGLTPTLGRKLALNSVKGLTGGAISGATGGLGYGLMNDENPLKTALAGAGLGAGIGAGLPLGGALASQLPKVGNWVFKNSFAGLKPKTVEQLIKPNSVALDLNEETAQNLLMDTTEGIQKAYRGLLEKAGNKVGEVAQNLPNERGVFADALQNTLDDIYGKYSRSGDVNINPAYNAAGDIYTETTKLIKKAANPENRNKINASKLYDIMENVKEFPIDFTKTSASKKQAIMKQIYSDFSRKLGNLSPELRNANKAYSELAKFDDNEGVRKIINPNVIKNESIDTASSTLRNYNSTVTKGNTNRNIQDLEKILVKNGYEPFLNKIDDVNAANELLKTAETGINPFGLTDKLKNIIERPVLKAARGINRAVEQAPEYMPQWLQNEYNSIGRVMPEAIRRLMTLGAVNAIPLQGGIQYNEQR